ncbi:hypothetical protein [Nocardioides luteus]|uniref:Uncharacterized protein n=1 Tax=Nocardioides luteus TaxID=1844 RepID=A0A1J4N688_9ACTN|nr:hypothetical protein [Nocardioides luteus]OIJ27006.1 hypothetical protein UG56_009505 [Nocardioides luteus]
MGILIEGTKVYEDDQTVTYSFLSPGTDRSGEVSITKSDIRSRLSTLHADIDPAAAKILMKAYRVASATGAWPDTVTYAA